MQTFRNSLAKLLQASASPTSSIN